MYVVVPPRHHADDTPWRVVHFAWCVSWCLFGKHEQVMLVHPMRKRGQLSSHPHADGDILPEVVAKCAVQCMGAEAFFEPLDVLALLLSALMHDLDHPGPVSYTHLTLPTIYSV